MKLRAIILVAMCILFALSCTLSYDRTYYTKASGIEIPNTSTVIEAIDNGEWYTVTSFNMKKDDMYAFINRYDFKPVLKGYRPTVFGEGNLQKERPPEELIPGYVFLMKSNGKLNCNYLIDTSRRILWASISYPDWSGD